MRPHPDAPPSRRHHRPIEALEVRTLLSAAAEGAATVPEASPYVLSLPATVDGAVPSLWNVQWGDSTGDLVPGTATTAGHTYGDGPATRRVTVSATVDGQSRPVPTRVASGSASPVLDPDFGQGGRAPHSGGSASVVAVAPDGKVVVGGYATDAVSAARYLPDGTRDATFGAGGVASVPLPVAGDTLMFHTREALVRPDGRVIVAGLWILGSEEQRWTVAQFNADGTPDASFAAGGLLVTYPGTSRFFGNLGDVALQPDGKLLVVGQMQTGTAENYNFAVARYLPDGTPDPDFGTGGTASIDFGGYDVADAVAVQPDGRIVVAGRAYERYDLGLARLTPAGQPDRTFDFDGRANFFVSTGLQVRDVVLQPDGKIVVAGGDGNAGGLSGMRLWRVNVNGTLDWTAAAPAAGAAGIAHRVFVQPDGRIVGAGGGGAGGGAAAMFRVLPNGTADTSFATPRSFAVDPAAGTSITDAELLPDGHVFAAQGSQILAKYLPEPLVRVTNVAPTARLSIAYPSNVHATVSLVDPVDPSAADRAGFRYSFDADNDGVFETNDVSSSTFTVPTNTTRVVRARIRDKDGGFTDYTGVVGPPAVFARRVFYNNSRYDNYDPAANAADDAAIATDKGALPDRQRAIFSNYTSYSRGINGLMVDVAGLPAGNDLDADDFLFRVGNVDDPSSWPAAPRPSSVTVRRGAGTRGSDRITLTWPDGAIRNTWLQVTVMSTAATGLARPDVFYFGNVIGEVGDVPGGATTTALDLVRTRRALSNRPAGITSAYDFNRDGRVNAQDYRIVRGSMGRGIRLIQTPPYQGVWQPGPDMPVALAEVAGGVIGNKLYVVGQGNGATLAYDLTTRTWSSAAALARRHYQGNHHAAEVVNGKLYLFGGLGSSSAGKVQVYDPVADTWTLGADMPFAAGSSSSAVINGLVYVAGGIVGSATTNRAARYDPAANRWTEVAPMPQGRNHAASGTDGTRLYVFGGRGPGSGDSNTVANGFDTVQIYNPANNTWVSSATPGSAIRPLPQARGGMGKAVFYGGEFYVFGGETATGAGATANGVYRRVDVYRPTTNTWRLENPMLTARHGIFPVMADHKVYLAGGGVRAGASSSDILEVLYLPLL